MMRSQLPHRSKSKPNHNKYFIYFRDETTYGEVWARQICNAGKNQPATYDQPKTTLKNIEGKRIWPAFGRHKLIYSSRQWAFNDSFKKQVKWNLNSPYGAYRYIGYGTILCDSYLWAKSPPGAKSMCYNGSIGNINGYSGPHEASHRA